MLASAGATRVILVSTYTELDLPADARTGGAAAYIDEGDLGPDLLRQLWAAAR